MQIFLVRPRFFMTMRCMLMMLPMVLVRTVVMARSLLREPWVSQALMIAEDSLRGYEPLARSSGPPEIRRHMDLSVVGLGHRQGCRSGAIPRPPQRVATAGRGRPPTELGLSGRGQGGAAPRACLVCSVVYEVVRPDMILIFRTQLDARSVIHPDPPFLWLFHWHFKPLAPPQTFDTFVIHLPTRVS